MTSTEKKFQLCFEACKEEAERLNEGRKSPAYVVERCSASEFAVYALDVVSFFLWEGFADIVRGLRFYTYFGIIERPLGRAHVAFFAYYA